MRAYLYIVSASKDPDAVTCKVPYEIDENEIFFGPCKKWLREELRREFLRQKDRVELDEEIFLVGFNGSNGKKLRKIVWAGRISHLMTFRRAEKDLTGDRYQEMLDEPDTPLHLRALRDGKPGYEHHGALHAGFWLADLVSDPHAPGIQSDGKRLCVEGEAGAAALTRDLCMLLENIYFAGGRSADGAGGIPVDDAIVEFLARVQRRDDVDAYRVFGRRSDGSAEGLTGRWLLLQEDDAREFMSLLRGRLPKPPPPSSVRPPRPRGKCMTRPRTTGVKC
jgi:hypothetical protein